MKNIPYILPVVYVFDSHSCHDHKISFRILILSLLFLPVIFINLLSILTILKNTKLRMVTMFGVEEELLWQVEMCKNIQNGFCDVPNINDIQ